MTAKASEQLTYGAYLKVADLLGLQYPLSSPEHHDEMLFIIVHQVHELWFKQVLHELDAVVKAISGNQLERASKHFRRIHTIQHVLEEQIDVLETMAPQDFNAFRDHLNPASGFQSIQFREIEFLCGVRRTDTLQYLAVDAAQQLRLERRLREPSLYETVKALLRRRGFPSETHDELLASLQTIYVEPSAHYDLFLLLEDLIEFDERFLLWRARHVCMVERMIGAKPGTGGSLGASYLAKTLQHRFFPELWEVRTYLGKAYG